MESELKHIAIEESDLLIIKNLSENEQNIRLRKMITFLYNPQKEVIRFAHHFNTIVQSE